MTHNICNECETVAHCSKHGCIPKVTLEPKQVKHVTRNDILRSAARSSGLDVYGLGLDRDKWEAALARYTEIIVGEYETLLPEICPWDGPKDSPMKGWHVQFVARKHFGV